jgi:hypothetical protein
MKPWIAQLQAEEVLPVDARPHRLSRLAVRQLLTKLHDGDQGETPGGQTRLTRSREEGGKVLILKDGAQGVPKRQVGTAVREGGPRHTRCLLGYSWNAMRSQRHDSASSCDLRTYGSPNAL